LSGFEKRSKEFENSGWKRHFFKDLFQTQGLSTANDLSESFDSPRFGRKKRTFGTVFASKISTFKTFPFCHTRSASKNKEDCEMLVLSRKEGERIRIGDNITLIVSKVSGNRVTIGIEAPKDVKVVRGELAENAVSVTADLPPSPNGASSIATSSRGASLREFAAAVLPLHRQVG
jgi:carbon storage regulator